MLNTHMGVFPFLLSHFLWNPKHPGAESNSVTLLSSLYCDHIPTGVFSVVYLRHVCIHIQTETWQP